MYKKASPLLVTASRRRLRRLRLYQHASSRKVCASGRALGDLVFMTMPESLGGIVQLRTLKRLLGLLDSILVVTEEDCQQTETVLANLLLILDVETPRDPSYTSPA